jgi:oxygen-independent coproporphyrinogen-3 oxidase
MPAKKASGIYIHIPFCHARCGYCDFVTFTGREAQIDDYVYQLCEEIKLAAVAGGQSLPPVSTVFFGGGTPSVLEAIQVSRILETLKQNYALEENAEITLEANPESVSLIKAEGWRQSGVTRISLGLQVMDDVLLKTLGRLHNVDQFKEAYRAVRAAGFDNVNIDLIYGLPQQDQNSWQQTLEATVALNPEHLSIYSLTVEEHTPFAAEGIKVNDDVQGEMYAWSRKYLKAQGYDQYEISNFAKAGRVCHHNLLYWRQHDYVGLGVGAVGCVDGLRWQNQKTLQAYEADIQNRRLPRMSEEKLDAATRKFENLMLGLRLREGFVWEEEQNPQWRSHRQRLASQGLLEELRPGLWRIPETAVHLTNQILLPFL